MKESCNNCKKQPECKRIGYEYGHCTSWEESEAFELKRAPHKNCESYVLGECSKGKIDFNCHWYDKYKCPVYSLSSKNEQLRAENKKYREALERIKNQSNFTIDAKEVWNYREQALKIAKQALKGGE